MNFESQLAQVCLHKPCVTQILEDIVFNIRAITQAYTHFATLKVRPIPGYIWGADSPQNGISFAMKILISEIQHSLISERLPGLPPIQPAAGVCCQLIGWLA